jgi:competence protein ComEC
MLTGFLKLLLVPLLPTLAALCSVCLDVFSDLFIWSVTVLAKLDPLSFCIGHVVLWAILLYYTWLFGVRFLPLPGKPRRSLAILGILVILLGLMAAKTQRIFSKNLTITCLSVGHGLAVVGEMPGGKTFLFDCGSISVKDPGGRVLIPFLNHRGIDTLDTIVISHGDLDHYNGLPEVLSAVRTPSIHVNPGFLERAGTSSAAGQMHSILQTTGEIDSPADLPSDFGPVRVKGLWPDEKTSADQSVSDNDKSEVILLEYAGRTVLLCGDIEDHAQTEILKQYPDLKADVLLLPHHGSRNNILPEFIRRLDPDIRVVSCARSRVKNVTTLDNQGINLYTPVNGAVTITIKADGTIEAVGFLDPP